MPVVTSVLLCSHFPLLLTTVPFMGLVFALQVKPPPQYRLFSNYLQIGIDDSANGLLICTDGALKQVRTQHQPPHCAVEKHRFHRSQYVSTSMPPFHSTEVYTRSVLLSSHKWSSMASLLAPRITHFFGAHLP